MEAAGFLAVATAIFLIIVAVLVFLMPLFVLKIRNEITSMNQKMSRVEDHLDAIREQGEKEKGENSPPRSL